MHNAGYKSALVRRACRYSDARPPRKTDGFLLESEIPPHMRGKAKMICDTARRVGITPAYAGKRFLSFLPAVRPMDHPRICGEKAPPSYFARYLVGSPPRMRGKAISKAVEELGGGITPAYAGKRLKRSRSAVPPVAIVPLFPSVCNKPVVSNGNPASRSSQFPPRIMVINPRP